MTRPRSPAAAPALLRLAITLLVLAGCRGQGPLKVGIVISEEAVLAAQLAASDINATGGIRGRPLSLEVISGGNTRASLALAAAESLSQDAAVIAVVGHSNSSASLSAAQIYNERKVVQVAPTSTAPLLSQAGPYTFRLVPADSYQAQFLAEEITGGGFGQRTAVFFVNDDYGHALNDALRKLLARAKVPIVYEARFTEGDSLHEVAGIARALSDAHPDRLVWLGRSRQLLELLPELRRVLPALPILASDGINDSNTESNADGAITGVRYVSLIDPTASRAALNDLRARFRAVKDRPLTVEGALTYDAVMLLATAARAVGPDREAIRGYLAGVGNRTPEYEGATGAIAFDENGDVPPVYFLAEFTPTGSHIVSRSPSK